MPLNYHLVETIIYTYITEEMNLDESQAIHTRWPRMGISEGYVGGSLHSFGCREEPFDHRKAKRHAVMRIRTDQMAELR